MVGTVGTVTEGSVTDWPPVVEAPVVEEALPVVEAYVLRRVEPEEPLDRPPLWLPLQVSGRLSLS